MSEQWTPEEIEQIKQDHEQRGSPPFQFNRVGPAIAEAYDDLDELPAPPRKDIPEADRLLLELAARALGARFEEVDGEGYGNLRFEDGSVVYGWNPLHFSGDTFELGVRLSLFDENATFQHHLATELSRGGDPLEANKRAVVLTAAATGKASNIQP